MSAKRASSGSRATLSRPNQRSSSRLRNSGTLSGSFEVSDFNEAPPRGQRTSRSGSKPPSLPPNGRPSTSQAVIERSATSQSPAPDVNGRPSTSQGTSRRGSSRKSAGRQPNLTREATFARTLSFVDCSLEQVEEAMQSVSPGYDLNMDFWAVVLSGIPSEHFKPLQNRTLTFWVKAFNKWLELRQSERSEIVSGQIIQEMMFLSKDSLSRIATLFDPEGARRLANEGTTSANVARLKISAPELMCAGVMLSRLISSQHKISFLFGLFDCDDDHALNRKQFSNFVRGFIRGLGAAFAIGNDFLPSDDKMKAVVTRLYKRISDNASAKVKHIYTAGSEDVKKALLSELRLRKQGISQAVDKALLGFKKTHTEQAIPYAVLQDWCFGQSSDKDPLALPYRLALERFCPSRVGADIADEFDEHLKDFSLSHSAPVQIPEDASVVPSKDLLSRAEVLFTRLHHRDAQEQGRWRPSMAEVESNSIMWGIQVSKRFKATMVSAFENLCSQKRRFAHSDNLIHGLELIDIFRKMCPIAQPKHLRMFEVWCNEYDAFLKEQRHVESIEQAAETYLENNNKPVMPDCELEILEKEFQKMDYMGRGYVTIDDIVSTWGWSDMLARDTVAAYDVLGDGYLDKGEFFKMMCPEEYRLPEMSGFGRQIFGKLLEFESKSRRRSAMRQSIKYGQSGINSDELDAYIEPPQSVFPEVDEEQWRKWNEVFESLDTNKNGKVALEELQNSGLLSWSVCTSIVALINPEDLNGFTKEGFMQAMARAYGRRVPHGRS